MQQKDWPPTSVAHAREVLARGRTQKLEPTHYDVHIFVILTLRLVYLAVPVKVYQLSGNIMHIGNL